MAGRFPFDSHNGQPPNQLNAQLRAAMGVVSNTDFESLQNYQLRQLLFQEQIEQQNQIDSMLHEHHLRAIAEHPELRQRYNQLLLNEQLQQERTAYQAAQMRYQEELRRRQQQQLTGAAPVASATATTATAPAVVAPSSASPTSATQQAVTAAEAQALVAAAQSQVAATQQSAVANATASSNVTRLRDLAAESLAGNAVKKTAQVDRKRNASVASRDTGGDDDDNDDDDDDGDKDDEEDDDDRGPKEPPLKRPTHEKEREKEQEKEREREREREREQAREREQKQKRELEQKAAKEAAKKIAASAALTAAKTDRKAKAKSRPKSTSSQPSRVPTPDPQASSALKEAKSKKSKAQTPATNNLDVTTVQAADRHPHPHPHVYSQPHQHQYQQHPHPQQHLHPQQHPHMQQHPHFAQPYPHSQPHPYPHPHSHPNPPPAAALTPEAPTAVQEITTLGNFDDLIAAAESEDKASFAIDMLKSFKDVIWSDSEEEEDNVEDQEKQGEKQGGKQGEKQGEKQGDQEEDVHMEDQEEKDAQKDANKDAQKDAQKDQEKARVAVVQVDSDDDDNSIANIMKNPTTPLGYTPNFPLLPEEPYYEEVYFDDSKERQVSLLNQDEDNDTATAGRSDSDHNIGESSAKGEEAGPKAHTISNVLDYPYPIDTWWPSITSIRRERRQSGDESSDEDEFVEDPKLAKETHPFRANIKKIRSRLLHELKPGVLEKIPHCKLHRMQMKKKKNISAPELVHCWQVTEIYPNDIMVCCSVCGTWRHAACGGHYKPYSVRENIKNALVPVCEFCHKEEIILREFPEEVHQRLERQRIEQLRRGLATSAVMRQASFSKHGGTYKWPLGRVSATHIGGHTRSVHSRHDKAEKQWTDMATRLGRGYGYRPKERMRHRTKELERLLVSVEDAEAQTDRHNMFLFLLEDTSKKHPVGFKHPRRNIFDPEEDDSTEDSDNDEESQRESEKAAADTETEDDLDGGEDNSTQHCSGAAAERVKIKDASRACCARDGCRQQPRFDSLFCSDACGVSALELDLLRSFQESSDIHPSVLRN